MMKYEQFKRYFKKKVTTAQEAEQMARAYLMYLFGASLYPSKRSRVQLSQLPALRDLRTTSRLDWGGAALGTVYAFMGNASRTEQAIAGYWRIWELWAYEVLNMCRPATKCQDLRILPHAHVWSKKNMGEKKGKGDLDGFRIYLNELHATSGIEPEPKYLARSRVVTANQWHDLPKFQVRGPLPPRASHTGEYTLAELEEFTQPDTDLARYLQPECDYATYQREHWWGHSEFGISEMFGVRCKELLRRGELPRRGKEEVRAMSNGVRVV
ncbi:uncharacterized protein LOC131332868 [Rhododendron vialii]|uniref:uncharacterized protein LOC131332868 n=1 Tax=Rhododendron vialii TaxID=182163 RepID=UPI00265E83AB|nr:uncharacterized protein LOC131332868 [Rhododendron vialii]